MSDLKERYIHAVVKNLPRASRQDIRLELETLIEDMLEARCGEETPTEKDIRVVLTELGTPAELFRKYSPDAGKVLIGEEHYPQYKHFVTIVLAAVLGGLLLSSILRVVLGENALWEAAVEFIGKAFAGLLSGFGAVTLAFIWMEKKGIKVGLPSDTIENLPPVPRHTEKNPTVDCILGMVLAAGFGLLLLRWSHLMTICLTDEGSFSGCYSLFRTEKLLEGRLFILLMTASGLAREVLRLIIRKRTVRLLLGTALCDGLTLVFAGCTFLRPEVVNPAMVRAVEGALTDAPMIAVQALTHVNAAFYIILAAAVVIDLAVDAVRTLR